METSNMTIPDSIDRIDDGQTEHKEINLDFKATPSIPLSAYVKKTVDLYFSQMKDHDVVNLYEIVISEVERPLLESALSHCGYNQTKTAKALGVSRSTLRKKLEQFGLS